MHPQRPGRIRFQRPAAARARGRFGFRDRGRRGHPGHRPAGGNGLGRRPQRLAVVPPPNHRRRPGNAPDRAASCFCRRRRGHRSGHGHRSRGRGPARGPVHSPLHPGPAPGRSGRGNSPRPRRRLASRPGRRPERPASGTAQTGPGRAHQEFCRSRTASGRRDRPQRGVPLFELRRLFGMHGMRPVLRTGSGGPFSARRIHRPGSGRGGGGHRVPGFRPHAADAVRLRAVPGSLHQLAVRTAQQRPPAPRPGRY